MKRRVLVILSMTLVLVGTVTVLAQQSSPQRINPTEDPHGTAGHHYGGVVRGGESGLLTQHLSVAKAQLMEARREVDPSARIDRVITALDELVIALEYIDAPGVQVDGHEADPGGGHSPGVVTHNGGCG